MRGIHPPPTREPDAAVSASMPLDDRRAVVPRWSIGRRGWKSRSTSSTKDSPEHGDRRDAPNTMTSSDAEEERLPAVLHRAVPAPDR